MVFFFRFDMDGFVLFREAWSAQKQAKTHKVERREKRQRKKEFEKKSRQESAKQDDDADDDWDDLAKEERMAKKLKKRKINAQDFDDMFMQDDDE